MSTNRIHNVVSTGGWVDTLIPRGTRVIIIQARNAVNCSYKYSNNATETFTVKSGTVREIRGNFGPEIVLQTQAANAEVLEIELTVSGNKRL